MKPILDPEDKRRSERTARIADAIVLAVALVLGAVAWSVAVEAWWFSVEAWWFSR